MIKYPNVAAGLQFLFYSEIIQIIGGIACNIPAISIVGTILKIVGLAIAAYGISGARKDMSAGFDTAFIVVTANAVANILLIFLSGSQSIFTSIISTAAGVLSLMVIYYICNSTGRLLLEIKEWRTAGLGDSVWKFTLISIIISVASAVLTMFSVFVPPMLALCAVMMLVAAVIAIIVQIMFMVYLNKSYKLLNTPVSTEDPFAQYYENPQNINRT